MPIATLAAYVPAIPPPIISIFPLSTPTAPERSIQQFRNGNKSQAAFGRRIQIP